MYDRPQSLRKQAMLLEISWEGTAAEIVGRVSDSKGIVLMCQGGTVKLYKGLACPLDGYEIVLFSLTGPDAKTYPLCPFCYNNPPAGAMQVTVHPCSQSQIQIWYLIMERSLGTCP